MDLNELTFTETSKPCPLVHPVTGEDLLHDGQPVEIMVRGADHPEMQKLERAVSNKRLKAAQRTGRVNLTATEIEAETLERLATCITGWNGLYKDGVPISYSHQAARDMMRDFSWMRDQVDQFFRDAGNFLNSTETSKLN